MSYLNRSMLLCKILADFTAYPALKATYCKFLSTEYPFAADP